MKKFIIANWKCNPKTLIKAKQLFNSIKKVSKNTKNTEVIICPPFIYLKEIKKLQKEVKLGAQNSCWEEKGAFTGEISPLMLKDLGCEYVILGHSERRKYFSENDDLINKRLKSALKSGLKPILCIDNISQIKEGLKGISKQKVIIAYEPIWAIGTGKACGYKEAKKFNLLMKKALGERHITLYGGSVNSQNALGYIADSGFQGLLIGGASLNSKEFVKIVKLFSKI